MGHRRGAAAESEPERRLEDEAFREIVVTDDRGRFVLPELPAKTHRIWVRGYGLRDSKKVAARPGATLELRAQKARSKVEAARIYPSNYWLSLFRPPADTTSLPGGRQPATWMSDFGVDLGSGKENENSADMHHYVWLDKYDTLGMGKDTVILCGTNSDSLLAFSQKGRLEGPRPLDERGSGPRPAQRGPARLDRPHPDAAEPAGEVTTTVASRPPAPPGDGTRPVGEVPAGG